MSFEERIIENPIFALNLRLFFKDEEPYFIGIEVARKLRFRRPDKIIRNIGEKHKMPLRELCKGLSETRKSEIFSKLNPLTTMIDEYAFFATSIPIKYGSSSLKNSLRFNAKIGFSIILSSKLILPFLSNFKTYNKKIVFSLETKRLSV